MSDEIHSGQEIISAAQKLSQDHKPKQVAVAAASDVAVLEAVSAAVKKGICTSVLCGNQDTIKKMADENDIDLAEIEIKNYTDPQEAAYNAVKLADQGEADVIMKGFISTSGLLKTVLSRDFSLRGPNTLSHTAVLDIPGYHKMIGITDGGMVVKPDFETKIQMIENSAMIFRALGFNKPKVALSGAIDYVDDNFPSTLLNQRILEHYRAGKIEGCEVFGPLTFDAATSREVARLRGIESPVAGDADIFVVDSIEECNIASKVMILFIKAIFAGVIVGARVPVSLVSRTDSAQNRMASLSIACLVAHKMQSEGGK
ncbi:MAG: phosphate butyryltransferase [candidate division Zixibacteria bacterium]|nr:phosphate butyryltransferase [candidate division Zixibacteria bacterium]